MGLIGSKSKCLLPGMLSGDKGSHADATRMLHIAGTGKLAAWNGSVGGNIWWFQVLVA